MAAHVRLTLEPSRQERARPKGRARFRLRVGSPLRTSGSLERPTHPRGKAESLCPREGGDPGWAPAFAGEQATGAMLGFYVARASGRARLPLHANHHPGEGRGPIGEVAITARCPRLARSPNWTPASARVVAIWRHPLGNTVSNASPRRSESNPATPLQPRHATPNPATPNQTPPLRIKPRHRKPNPATPTQTRNRNRKPPPQTKPRHPSESWGIPRGTRLPPNDEIPAFAGMTVRKP